MAKIRRLWLRPFKEVFSYPRLNSSPRIKAVGYKGLFRICAVRVVLALVNRAAVERDEVSWAVSYDR